MFMDFWCEIYESVKRKPSRTILTGIGISWGIFILIVLVGIGSGFERECSNSSMDSLKARLMYMRTFRLFLYQCHIHYIDSFLFIFCY